MGGSPAVWSQWYQTRDGLNSAVITYTTPDGGYKTYNLATDWIKDPGTV